MYIHPSSGTEPTHTLEVLILILDIKMGRGLVGTAQLGRHTASQKDTRTVASPSKLYVALKHSWPNVTFITVVDKKNEGDADGEGGESKKEQNRKREMKRREKRE